jgi:Kef-type K+ transport system membrane component KefB
MKLLQRFYPLLGIYIILLLIFFGLTRFTKIELDFFDISVFLSGALIISTIVSIVFFTGLKKPGSKALSFTLAAIVLKLILFMIFMASFILITKNTSLQYILTFFVIYLSFTFYLLFTFVEVLKQKRMSPDA